MRFQQLAVGERFEFEGDIYVKVDALIAQVEGSHTRRLIPRYAQLAAPGREASTAAAAEGPPRREVTSAFDTFCASCMEIVEELAAGLPPERIASVRARFEAARQAFLTQTYR